VANPDPSTERRDEVAKVVLTCVSIAAFVWLVVAALASHGDTYRTASQAWGETWQVVVAALGFGCVLGATYVARRGMFREVVLLTAAAGVLAVVWAIGWNAF
jgi:hypothetical protein